MMPGIGFAEMIILALVAIVVIGPKDLPLMMRKFGRLTGKMRALAFEFKQGFDELGRQAELEELRREVADLKKHTGLDDLQKDFEQDQIALAKDVDSAMAPASLPPAPGQPAEPNGAAPAPAVAPYAGLSADHPGYDTGGDIGEDVGEDVGSDAVPSQPEPSRGAESKEEPVKQDTPA